MPPFNPETHREDFQKAQDEVDRQLTNAHEQALKDNEDFDEITGRKNLSKEWKVGEFSPQEIEKMLKDLGSPATLDTSFEGGIIHLEIDKELQEKLKDWEGAKKAYQEADNNYAKIFTELDKIPYTAPINTNLDVLVLNPGLTTPEKRDKLVEDMDKIGYRPLEFSELVTLGIIKPEHNKRNEALNIYKKYFLGDFPTAPFLRWDGVNRSLYVNSCAVNWGGWNRFLFVRK